MIPLAALEEIIDASGVAPRIEAMLPIGVRPRQLTVRTLLAGHVPDPGRSPARAPDPGAPGADQPARGRPAAARRDRGLEERPAPAHLPADRAHLRPGHRGPGQGRARRAALADAAARTCDDLLEASIPGQFKDASTSLAVDWTDLESFSRPPPRGSSDCADPEASWGHRKNNLLRSEDELFFGYYLSAGIMMPEENGPPSPSWPAALPLSSCQHDPVRAFAPVLTAMPAAGHPARRHPRRLRLRPPRRRTPGPSRCAPPARSWSRTCTRTTAAPRAPTTAPSSPTATSTARPPPRPLLELGPLARAATRGTGRRARHADRRAGPLQARPHHQRRRRRLPPRAVPRRHGQDPLPAAPGVDDAGPGPARDPHPARAPPGLLRPADHHRPAGRAPPRPRRNTTTRPRRTAAPTPAAPAPNAASPPPRTPPPTTSAAAGAASWAWPRSCSGSPACSPSATSASSPPGTPARKTTPAAPPPGLPPKTRRRRRKTLASLAAEPP